MDSKEEEEEHLVEEAKDEKEEEEEEEEEELAREEPAWQAVYDEQAQEYYYWNSLTKETTWDKPQALIDLEAAEAVNEEEDGPPAVDKEAEQQTPNTTAAEGGTTATPGAEIVNADYYNSKEYYDWYMGAMAEYQIKQSASQTAATFAASKQEGRFAELASLGISGLDNTSRVASREYKQMSHFFDVEKYQKDRAFERTQPKVVKKLTKKDIQKFQKQKHERKVASLIQRMGPDS